MANGYPEVGYGGQMLAMMGGNVPGAAKTVEDYNKLPWYDASIPTFQKEQLRQSLKGDGPVKWLVNDIQGPTSPIIGYGGQMLDNRKANLVAKDVWMPGADDPASKYFNKETLQRLFLQDDGQKYANIGSLDSVVPGFKQYLMDIGVEGADDDKHKLYLNDITSEGWGMVGKKQKSNLRTAAETAGKTAAFVGAAMGGAALAAGAGVPGAGAAVGQTTSGFLPAVGGAGGSLGSAGAGAGALGGAEVAGGSGMFSGTTPTSLSGVMDSVGATDFLTMGAGELPAGVVNAGGGLEGLISAGLGQGGSGYGLVDAVTNLGLDKPGILDSLLDQGKEYLGDKLKNPDTYKDIFDAVTGGGKGEGQTGSVGQNLALMMQNQPITLPNRATPEQIAELMMQRGQQGGQQGGQGIPLGVNITV